MTGEGRIVADMGINVPRPGGGSEDNQVGEYGLLVFDFCVLILEHFYGLGPCIFFIDRVLVIKLLEYPLPINKYFRIMKTIS